MPGKKKQQQPKTPKTKKQQQPKTPTPTPRNLRSAARAQERLEEVEEEDGIGGDDETGPAPAHFTFSPDAVSPSRRRSRARAHSHDTAHLISGTRTPKARGRLKEAPLTVCRSDVSRDIGIGTSHDFVPREEYDERMSRLEGRLHKSAMQNTHVALRLDDVERKAAKVETLEERINENRDHADNRIDAMGERVDMATALAFGANEKNAK